jgi:glutamine amidotransferase
MSRLFAYMGNDPDRVACALYSARKLLVADPAEYSPPAAFDSWGIGFYQGEVLLQRRPKAPPEPVDFYAISKELRTDVVIGHVRAGTFGKPKHENTHPFRFRSWLFAHHGSIPNFEQVQNRLLEAVPDFLRRNIRGQTDSEHLFHLFLAHLHEAGKLDDANVSPFIVREALRATLLQLEEWIGPDVARAAECALAVTNGRILVATRHGKPVQLLRIESVSDCPVCREATPAPGKPYKRVDHEHLRAVTLVAEAPKQTGGPWQEVPDDSFIAVAHDLSVQITPIHD